ncbi:C4-dicarboxylate TRAP transporter large permease protein DctM [wastewater metagenome]|uniref:C4-dicarboxylate TRAP transporter large permease protein DctM n=2 Tax=unclassified sequences TaxID=12908 RepID=A0A5B8RB62_9ZZZZ|nr:TRAP transporter large permease [Arhodomonas sp. KWT]QEA04684.1 C4-dicarboxylate TRAP transporter large permease protein DctM [uncultured organism]
MLPTPDVMLFLVLAALIVIGSPIAIALALAGAVGIVMGLPAQMLGTLGTNTYNAIAKYPLVAIPLFVLTGTIFERAGVAANLVRFARALIGPRPGGLAVVATLVCLIMGGMSGSGPADAAAVAMVMVPSMTRAGYPRAFSATVIAASASTAILIPPSVALILYSILVPGVDLRALFAAGVFPGLLAGLAVVVPAIWLARRNGFERRDAEERPPLRESFIGALPALFAPVIILGGLRSGLFTPTEAAVVAVAYGVFIGMVVYRNLDLRTLYRALVDSAVLSAVILLIISLAGIFAWAGSTLGAFDDVAHAMLSVSDTGWIVLAMVMLLLLVAGMVLDGVSIYLILIPMLMPVMRAFDWNATWFGILMAMTIAVGQFTPPVAVNLMVTTKVAEVPMERTLGWAAWMVAAMVIALALVIVFPGVALWLPEALGYRV